MKQQMFNKNQHGSGFNSLWGQNQPKFYTGCVNVGPSTMGLNSKYSGHGTVGHGSGSTLSQGHSHYYLNMSGSGKSKSSQNGGSYHPLPWKWFNPSTPSNTVGLNANGYSIPKMGPSGNILAGGSSANLPTKCTECGKNNMSYTFLKNDGSKFNRNPLVEADSIFFECKDCKHSVEIDV